MKQISRRSFLKIFGTGTVAAAAATTIGCKNNNEGTRMQDEPAEGKMTYRITPTTKDKVSVLGYGMMRLPTVGQGKAKKGKRQTGDEEIDQNMVNKQIDYALKHGLNYFDTAPVYCKGQSERATGIALKRHPRNSYYIATKLSNFGAYTREESIEMFNNSLKELQTTYIDYYLLHAIGGRDDDHEPMELFNARFIDNGMLDYCLQKKKEGTIRNLGFSYHGDIEVFNHALKLHDDGKAKWDFVQIEMNYLDWHWANEITEENTDACYLYNELKKRGIPAIIMEPLLGGRLANLPDPVVAKLKSKAPERSVASWAFRYCTTYDNVLTALSGMTYMEHLKDNLRNVCPLEPLTDKEIKWLEGPIAKEIMSYKTIPCNDCKYCMPCPYGIDIPGIFVHYNHLLMEGHAIDNIKDPNYKKYRKEYLVTYDRAVPKVRQADHCIGCGQCMPKCPQQIMIPEELQRVGKFVEKLKRNE
jgi:hypothetical protein